MNTTTDLLETLRAHLAAFEVPALFSIRLTPATVGPNVSAQLDGHHVPQMPQDYWLGPTLSPKSPLRRGEFLTGNACVWW
jgi:hypothetical protein